MAKVTRNRNGILSTYETDRINLHHTGGDKPSASVHSYANGSVGGVQIGKVANSDDNFTIGTAKMLSFTDSAGTKATQVIKWITELYEKEQEAHLKRKEETEKVIENV